MTTLCHENNELREAGEVFVNTVSRLIGLILDYRRVEGDSSQSGQRMGCILNLLVRRGEREGGRERRRDKEKRKNERIEGR